MTAFCYYLKRIEHLALAIDNPNRIRGAKDHAFLSYAVIELQEDIKGAYQADYLTSYQYRKLMENLSDTIG